MYFYVYKEKCVCGGGGGRETGTRKVFFLGGGRETGTRKVLTMLK